MVQTSEALPIEFLRQKSLLSTLSRIFIIRTIAIVGMRHPVIHNSRFENEIIHIWVGHVHAFHADCRCVTSAFIVRTVKHGAALHATFPLNGKILIENLCGNACVCALLLFHIVPSATGRWWESTYVGVRSIRTIYRNSCTISEKQTFSQNCRYWCCWQCGQSTISKMWHFTMLCGSHCRLAWAVTPKVNFENINFHSCTE